jgi:hypothetical protein
VGQFAADTGAIARSEQEKREMTEVAEVFGATSTTEDVLTGIDLRGKRILVTGVSAGLGVETARPSPLMAPM